MVTKAVPPIGENGNGWGIFEISDYTGAYEIKLFGEDPKVSPPAHRWYCHFCRRPFPKGWKDDGEMDLKVLRTPAGRHCLEHDDLITLKLPLEHITDTIITELEACRHT